jgi:hypothetical protein
MYTVYIGKRNKWNMAISVSLLQIENGNAKLPFVCCILKWKTEICFPSLANDKRFLTSAVSAKVPIYGSTTVRSEQIRCFECTPWHEPHRLLLNLSGSEL